MKTIPEQIGIQGYPGSNTEFATQKIYGREVPLAYYKTFPGALRALRDGRVGGVTLAFANNNVDSQSGLIKTPFAELLSNGSQYFLTAKTEVLVGHHLQVIKGASLADIEVIHTMGVAQEQCEGKLKRKVPRATVKTEDDTALSAQIVRRLGLKSHAALAPRRAAELNGLDIVASNLQDDPHNTTQFFSWMLREAGIEQLDGSEDRTLMLVKVPDLNEVGILNRLTGIMQDNAVNMTDLHSIHVPRSPRDEKQFLIETEGSYISEPLQDVERALTQELGCLVLALGSWEQQPQLATRAET